MARRRLTFAHGACSGHAVTVHGEPPSKIRMSAHDYDAETAVVSLGGAISDCYRLSQWLLCGDHEPNIHDVLARLDAASLEALKTVLPRLRTATPREPTRLEARMARLVTDSGYRDIVIKPGRGWPVVRGTSAHYRSESGQIVLSPNRYRAAGGRVWYTHSTKHITVGQHWLAYLAIHGVSIESSAKHARVVFRGTLDDAKRIIRQMRSVRASRRFVRAVADAAAEAYGEELSTFVDPAIQVDGVAVIQTRTGEYRAIKAGKHECELWSYPATAHMWMSGVGEHVLIGDILCSRISPVPYPNDKKPRSVRIAGVVVSPCWVSYSEDGCTGIDVGAEGASILRGNRPVARLGHGHWSAQTGKKRGLL